MPATKIRINPRKDSKGRTRYTAYYLAPDGQSWLSAGTEGDKAVAKVKAQNAYEASRKAGWVDPRGSRTLLGNYADDTFFPNLSGIAIKTRVNYKSAYDNHVKPEFGDKEMGEILYSHISGWIKRMEDAKVGRHTQLRAFTVLQLILKAARRDRLIPTVETEGIKPQAPQPRDVVIFYPDEWPKFFAALPEIWQPLVQTLHETGMRPEEVRALCPAQIDFRGTNKITIDRALVQVAKKDGGPFVAKEPKDHEIRKIKVGVDLLKLLARQIQARGLLPTSEEPIFMVKGRLFRNERLEEVFEAACEEAKIPRRMPKDCRSTRASWMLKENGGDLVAVQRYLGHSDIKTTQKYLGLIVSNDELAEVINFEDWLKDDEADNRLEEAQ